ncbi:hypothetical protein [Promicromonospora sp. NPDC023987]|uniref:hypothetical protein n=1 Tax=Promicromonospora sp. NPDC023987 TaxID=3155360 RepID=UPI0033E835CC
MFDDGAEQFLDDAYGDDEHAKAAARADIAAMHDHVGADATAAHDLIALQVWKTLRALGISEGRFLALGPYPEVLAGLPPSERRLEPGQASGFTGQIPSGRDLSTTWPHHGTVLRAMDEDTFHDEHDVVLSVAPYVDVALHRPGITDQRRLVQTVGVVSMLEATEPGGFAVALVSQELLDDPDPQFRQYIAHLGELAGAVRLPAGALRTDPGNDRCVDLLVLRRHLGAPHHPHTFLRSSTYERDGLQTHLNAYYQEYPEQMLGQPTIQRTIWSPAELTVRPSDAGLEHDLAVGMDAIVTFAREMGLTADTLESPREAYEVDLDAPIPLVPTDLPQEAYIVDPDTARERIAELRADRRPPDPDGPPRPRGPGAGPGM